MQKIKFIIVPLLFCTTIAFGDSGRRRTHRGQSPDRRQIYLELQKEYKAFLTRSKLAAPKELCERLPTALAEDAGDDASVSIDSFAATRKRAWFERCFEERANRPTNDQVGAMYILADILRRCSSPNIDNGDDDERQRCDAFVANAYPLLTTFDFVAESSGEVGLSIDRGRFIDIPRDPMASCEVLNKLNVLFLGYCPVVN